MITQQALVARDARLVTGVLDAIVDLELIGDYAYETATLSSSMGRRPPSQVLAQLSDTGAKTQEILVKAIDCWRSGETAQALSMRPKESGGSSSVEAAPNTSKLPPTTAIDPSGLILTR